MLNKEYIKLVNELSIQFAKYHYNEYLKTHNIDKINESELPQVVESLYTNQKKKELFKFLRHALKEMLKENYNPLCIEPIISEINDDDSLAKKRIITEIELYQNQS